MFETEIEHEPSFVSYLVQQFAVPFIPWLIALFVNGELESRLFHNHDNGLLHLLLCSLIGAAGGLMVGWLLPWAVEMGTQVWMIPSTLFVVGFVLTAIGTSFHDSVLEFFWPPDQSESGWGEAILTGPAFCAITYSLALPKGTRLRARSGPKNVADAVSS